MSLTDLIVAAEEVAEHEPLIHPYIVGAVALAILLSLLAGLFVFGAGREHS